jgi:hypothetical protein
MGRILGDSLAGGINAMSARKNRKFLFLIALVVLAVTALVFAGREERHTRAVAATAREPPRESGSADKMEPFEESSLQTSPPLPPEGTPWAMSKSQLLARALRGDKAAAERLFLDTQSCAKALSLQNAIDSLASIRQSEMPREKYQEIQRDKNHLRELLAGSENMCTEGDKAELARDVDQILLAAAQSGDKKAVACYLDRQFHDLWRYQDISGRPPEAEFERYAQFAPEFVDAAVKDGNWSVVSFMGFVYGPNKNRGLLAQTFRTDPVKEYGYVKLQELGATGELKAQKAERLSSIRASGNVSEADLQQSEAWAQSTFEKYFHEPLETDQPPACFEPGA